MRTNEQKPRWLSQRLPDGSRPRLVVVTGARQTGKTTLSRSRYADLRYVNLDAVETRAALRQVRTSAWASSVGPAVLDEAQKEPSVFDRVKYAFDEGTLGFTVLLGSSRLLLLDRVRESLAGRAFVYDLWPLMASELRAGPEAPLQTPLLDQLATLPRIGSRLQQEPEVCLGPDEEEPRAALDHLSLWGGMPGLLWLDEVERRDWLRSYQQTFLERDLADLARLSDLVPFRTFQQLAMLRTGQVLSFAGLGRDAGLSASTARRYLEYLRLSYQVVLLPPFARNLTSSITKTPKLYWTDLGILRSATQRWGPLDGPLFETLVVSEVTKWLATMARDVRATFYRTRAGMEVDLVLSTAEGELGIEVKLATSVGPSEARSLRAFAAAAGDRWRGGLVVYRGAHLQPLDEGLDVWAMPVHRLLG